MRGGAVAIWHDIVPEGLAEFYAWHGEEHMPERVSIPGFNCGRRFVASQADLHFFNLYETESPDVVKGPQYKARLDSPSLRTLSAVKHFRNVARSLCRVLEKKEACEAGIGQGALMATLRYEVTETEEPAHVDIFQKLVIPALFKSAGVCSVSLLLADRIASGYVNAEQRARGAANLVPPIVLLVEGWADPLAFSKLVQSNLANEALNRIGLTGSAILGIYTHQLTVFRT